MAPPGVLIPLTHRLIAPALLLTACAAGPPLAPSQVCVARHAEAFHNLRPPPAGLTPAQLDSLTPAGEAQAEHLRTSLPAGVALVAASPLHRSRQTAERIRGALPARVEPDLRPMEGGGPWTERLVGWAKGEDPRPPGGESLADAQARLRALLARLRAELPAGGHAVLVTHSDISMVLIGELSGVPLLERPKMETLPNAQMRCFPLPGDPPLSGR